MEVDLNWWKALSLQWKRAFSETFFRHDNEPAPGELALLFASPALRFAGPRASFPNLSFELTDLSGIKPLKNLEILVVINHQIKTIGEVKNLTRLKNLFLYNNTINSLQGIEDLTLLEQLYVQWNPVKGIQPVQKLTNLKELYVHNTCLASLEGLTEQHSDKLEGLFCKPNDLLKQKEILRVERDLFIRCRAI